MQSEALYFPTIELPRDEWLRRTLLYWDVVGSIVPPAYLATRALSSYMTALIEVGLVRAIDPDEQLWRLTDFDEMFFTFLDADPCVHRDLRRDVSRPEGPVFRIRTEKFSIDTFTEFEYRGLAIREEDGWVAVRADVGELYLAYLAARICDLQEHPMDPITNNQALLRRFAWGSSGAREVHADLLALLLPAPPDDVAPVGLLAFKERYSGELKAFRRYVENAVLQVISAGPQEVRDQAIRVVELESVDELATVEARLRERGWSTDPASTALTILAPGGPAAALLASGKPGLAAGAAPAISLATYLALRRRRKNEQSPLAYAVHARSIGA